MLKLESSNTINISEIAGLLAQYNISADVSKKGISFGDGVITPEGLIQLAMMISPELRNLNVHGTKCDLEEESGIDESSAFLKPKQHTTKITVTSCDKERYVRFPHPVYGQIYWVDFGSPFGYEEAYERPALVVKGDGNFRGVTTVIPMTSQTQRYDPSCPLTPIFTLSEETAEDYNPKRLSVLTDSCLLIEQLTTVDTSRLHSYACTLKADFMDKLMSNVKALFKKPETETEFEPELESELESTLKQNLDQKLNLNWEKGWNPNWKPNQNLTWNLNLKPNQNPNWNANW